MKTLKNKIFRDITEFIEDKGFSEYLGNFMEGNVCNQIFSIVILLIGSSWYATKRKLSLYREKRIVSTNTKTEGYQEFVSLDVIGIENSNIIFIEEGKQFKLQSAIMQCKLALRNMADNNHDGGVLYFFIMTGNKWQINCYQYKISTFPYLFNVISPIWR